MSNQNWQVQNFINTEFDEQVRGVNINGIAYVVGIDVAKALSYAKPANALKRHVDEEDKLSHQIRDSGQNRNVTLINEYGVYSLILGSKLPNAKKFKRRVVSEVLPSIRKTGEYKIKDNTNDQQLPLQQAVRKEGKLYRCECTDAIKQLCIQFDLVGTKMLLLHLLLPIKRQLQ